MTKEESKKDYTSLIYSIVILLIVILLVGIMTVKKHKRISLNDNNVSIMVGEEYTIDYTVDGLSKEQLVWDTSDPYVAIVSSGKIQGVNAGVAVISVSDGKNNKENLRVEVINE